MTIAWDLFTPWSAFAGGVLIGLAAALYLLGNGRIAGVAGIVASQLRALLALVERSPSCSSSANCSIRPRRPTPTCWAIRCPARRC